jgi:hypothetical protein
MVNTFLPRKSSKKFKTFSLIFYFPRFVAGLATGKGEDLNIGAEFTLLGPVNWLVHDQG